MSSVAVISNPKLPRKIDFNRAMAEKIRRPGGFYFFVKEFWTIIIPEKPVWNWHIEYFCQEAERIIRRLATRQPNENDYVINVPPGSTKSAIWTMMLPPWAWIIDPTLRILSTSFSDTVAMKHAMKSRDIIQSDKYMAYFPFIAIRKDQNNKSDYENTYGGQRYAAGISGSITSMHFHLILIDDPLNPKEAASEAECASACELIDSTLSTRKVDKAMTVTVLIMQRLSEKDPSAHLLDKIEKGKKIKHICLPAELRDGVKPEALGAKYVNGLLDPIRLSKQILADALIDLGSANYAGQYGQRPAPAKGLIWQRWFIEIEDSKFPSSKEMTQYGTDWDTAYTKEDSNAASAYVTAGKIGHNIYIDDFDFEWKEFPQLIQWMKTKPSPHYIEAKASGKSSQQTLVQNGVVAIEVPVIGGGDKIARANMATPMAQAGMVYIRKSIAERLYTDPKQGILVFPRGKFKDVADALAQSLQRLSNKNDPMLFPLSSLNFYTQAEMEDIKSFTVKMGACSPGEAYFTFSAGYLANGKIYLHDIIFNQNSSDITGDTVSFIGQNTLKTINFESHEAYFHIGQAVRKKLQDIKSKADLRIHKNEIGKNHMRILAQAQFIKDHICFRSDWDQQPQYRQFMENITSYMKNGDSKRDEAANNLALLSKFFQDNFKNQF